VSTVYFFNAVHPLKALVAMDVKEDGMVIDVKEEHPRNVINPIEVTDDGMDIDVIEEQPSKTLCPIDVTDNGIVIEVKPVQCKKVPPLIAITKRIITNWCDWGWDGDWR